MKIEEVEREMDQLRVACINAEVRSFNRFYFNDEKVIYNVTTKDGFLASARMINDELIIKKSKNKPKEAKNERIRPKKVKN